jgi:hypothetical protein
MLKAVLSLTIAWTALSILVGFAWARLHRTAHGSRSEQGTVGMDQK